MSFKNWAIELQVGVNHVLSCKRSLADIQIYLKKEKEKNKAAAKTVTRRGIRRPNKYTTEVHQSRLSESLNSTTMYLKRTPEMT
jgi:hypothetical protein